MQVTVQFATNGESELSVHSSIATTNCRSLATSLADVKKTIYCL